jgi:uncharacterized membrane protein YqjE
MQQDHPIADHGPPTGALTLIGRLAEDALRLVYQQVALARQEVREMIALTRTAAMLLAASALCALLALIMLLVLVVLVVPAHALAAATLVVVLVALATVLALMGKARLRVGPPERALPHTVASLKEDLEWVKQQLKRNGK